MAILFFNKNIISSTNGEINKLFENVYFNNKTILIYIHTLKTVTNFSLIKCTQTLEILRKEYNNAKNVYSSLLLNFLSEIPRAFTILVT